MPAIAIIGIQFGDEGKGKITDVLASSNDIVVRSQGGPNAGHTLFIKNLKLSVHQVPSGIVRDKISILGNGMVINPKLLLSELGDIEKFGFRVSNVKISHKAHVIFPYHQELDGIEEEAKGANKIGTTKQGIGPAYIDKVARSGIRMEDLLNEDILAQKIGVQVKMKGKIFSAYNKPFEYKKEDLVKEFLEYGKNLSKYIVDTDSYLINALKKKKRVLLEGAQGSLLDVDHGTYPFVTSSNTTIGGIISGSGIPPKYITQIVGVMKAYTTRVGSGPFPTELKDNIGEFLQKKGREFGTTTNRPRRCGWEDLVISKAAVDLNGVTEIALTKVDTLGGLEKINVCIEYEIDKKKYNTLPTSAYDFEKAKPIYKTFDGWKDLSEEEWNKIKKSKGKDMPKQLSKYLKFIEHYLGVPIKMLSYGPRRDQIILNPKI